jgi:hypothetical protein
MTGRGANRTLPCGAAYFPTKGRRDVSPLLIRRDHVGDMRPTRLAKDRGDLVDRFLEALDLQPRLGAAAAIRRARLLRDDTLQVQPFGRGVEFPAIADDVPAELDGAAARIDLLQPGPPLNQRL